MSKKRKNIRRREEPQNREEIAEKRKALGKMLMLVLVVAIIFGFYRAMLNFSFFKVVFWVYLAALPILIIAYFIYNKGMSAKGVTEDMLPDEWSDEEKTKFIEDGKQRLRKSSWMLMGIIGLLFTFSFDLIELFAVPLFKGM
ncbi:MAG: hypothetical protein E7607_08470 [Ruminococcaceae bacterium]|nr:hypothetical protein [Oscillospiraceae bacterium]